MSSNLDAELEAFLAEVHRDDSDVSAAASDPGDDAASSTQRDVPTGNAQNGHFAAPAPPAEQNPSAQNRETPVEGSESAQNVPSGHFSGHFAEVDGHFLPTTDSADIPEAGTNVAPGDEAPRGVETPSEPDAASSPDVAAEDRVVAHEDAKPDSTGNGAPAGKVARAVAWTRREAVDARDDWFRSDAWNQGHPAVKGTVPYTREAGWNGDGRVLRGLAHAYNWTVSIPGQYVGIQFAHTVRRPARFLVTVGLVVLAVWTVLTVVPANPVFGSTADLLRTAAGHLDK